MDIDRHGARALRDRFAAAIIHAEEMIKITRESKGVPDERREESVDLHQRLIRNYSQSIEFIDRHLNEPQG